MSSLNKLAYFGLVLSLSLLLVSFGFLALAEEDEENPLSDVSEDHWAYEDIKYLAERDIIKGLPDDGYQGEESITRYAVASLVARALRYAESSEEGISNEDLSTLEDLVFELSDRVDSMSSSNEELQDRVSDLESRVEDLQTGPPAEEYEELVQRSQNNFVLGIAGVAIGAISLAWNLLM
ncbi:MAG: S-layer homology domain-containing protein [Candidatus Acetothermia bacterium]